MLRLIPWILFLLTSCTRNNPVVKVGDYTLMEKDAHYRSAVIKIYFPDDNRDLGLDQLVRAYTYAQILKNHGREITPEIIARIKSVAPKRYAFELNALHIAIIAGVKSDLVVVGMRAEEDIISD